MIPLVSICLPSLNTRQFLEERMETIFSQTVTDWELIVCDSYSDDKSWEFFQKFKGDKRVRLFQVPREGLYAGWNECLRRVTGEYVYIATSDDTMQPTLLECLLVPLGRLPEVDIALCDYDFINEHGQPIARERRFSDEMLGEWVHIPSVRSGQTEFLLHMCSVTLWITMNSLLFRRRLLGRVGHFTTKFGSFGDIDWTLRSSLATDIAWVPQSLAGFRLHKGQATPQIFHVGPPNGICSGEFNGASCATSALASLLSGKRCRTGKSNCWLAAGQITSVLSNCIGSMPCVIPENSWHAAGMEHGKSLAGYWAGCCKV